MHWLVILCSCQWQPLGKHAICNGKCEHPKLQPPQPDCNWKMVPCCHYDRHQRACTKCLQFPRICFPPLLTAPTFPSMYECCQVFAWNWFLCEMPWGLLHRQYNWSLMLWSMQLMIGSGSWAVPWFRSAPWKWSSSQAQFSFHSAVIGGRIGLGRLMEGEWSCHCKICSNAMHATS